ncbi:N-6 DNA methylase [Candidatus Pacearchaeota archaeon]|nr:N-6 DNA methylase [Candidatus Pacearchaeota archaeon]
MPYFDTQNLREFLSILGFKPKEGLDGIWYKRHKNGYEISTTITDSLRTSKINYGEKIKCYRATTSNFGQPESFVVFECVNRLIEKGYSPENIQLEKDWALGHKTKGCLDIIVLDDKKNSFLMIECKTQEEEHRKEKEKMFKDGGQLFSYLIQEKTTQYICLYSSAIKNKDIVFENDIVQVSNEIISAKNQQEAFEAWTPQVFEAKGIFEKDITPYNINFTGILKKDLKNLTADDGGYVFNRFTEILRRNVVSDKTNAFNKIFNLFLCKIVDEFERDSEEKTQFQWGESEKDEEVMLRLNDLYKRGMNKYLGLEISAVTKDELDNVLSKVNIANKKDEIEKLFIQQKLYSGNEFAFKEVFDKKTFEQNAVVVKEVVKLLEKYRIKYSTKQQFLGDFFEKLLNTGIKQESGQFFTPIPITRFICRSIPIKNIIQEKNNLREENFLPYVIDYASGSGHFLTEVMDEINRYVSDIDENWIKGGGLAKRNFNALKNEYLWAKEYVYGIEKDYRLAKTTKISTFLNGDGDANIICGDGLDSFETSKEYKDKLLITRDGINNEQFDILIANPPYSVSGFKNTLKSGKTAFSLYSRLTEQSSEIECLFIERAKHLLKKGGNAGIVLPVSVLTNSGIYADVRNLIIRNFEIKAIVAFSNNTFMETNTNTVTIFLKKRSEIVAQNCDEIVAQFLKNFGDVTCNNIEKAFSKYVSEIYTNLSFTDYINLLEGNFKKVENSLIYKQYKRIFRDNNGGNEEKFLQFIITNERAKMICFMLTFNKTIVLAKSGEKKAEKKFLGYEFSSRRGCEGIKIHKDESGKIISKLYNEDELNDPSKVNNYILMNFLNQKIEKIDNELKNNLMVQNLHELIDFTSNKFEQKIIPSFKKKRKLTSKFPLEPLDECVSIIDNGTNAPQEIKYFNKGVSPFIRAGNLNTRDLHGYIIPNKESYVNQKAIKECGLKEFPQGTILFPKSGQSVNTDNIGKLKTSAYVVNHLACIYDKNQDLLSYLYYFLEDYKTSNLVRVDSNYPSINLTEIRNLLVPIPPKEILLKINKDMFNIENKQKRAVESIIKSKEKIRSIFENLFRKHSNHLERLEEASLMVKRGKTPKYGNSNLKIIKSGQVRGFYDFDFSEKHLAHKNFDVDNRKLEIGDILINSTGVGTAGRVNYFDLTGDYTVDSHITIVRPDQNKIIPKIILYSLAYIGFDVLEKMAEGQSGQIELSPETIKNLKIPFPDEKVQKKILDEIEKAEKEIKAGEKIISVVSAEKSKLLNKYLY